MDKSNLKKAIIFDCDNTLWEGIVGEEEVTPNIKFQNEIIFLARRGVIIGLCSKNNEADVEKVLKTHPLTEDYISVKRINWKDKASNLREIAQELNIGLDAMVMVDDSEFETSLIQSQLPEVTVIHPRNLMATVMDSFDLTGDITKTEQYKANYQRAKYQEQFTNIDDYLTSLDMVLTININDQSQIPRIVELTQKTNQFNLTTERCTIERMEYLMFIGRVYSLSVTDKFGDNGLTGVCIVTGDSIEVFLLSCRILGRNIEYAFMDWIMKNLQDISRKFIFGVYIPSEKNKQVNLFYKNLGFEYSHSYKEQTVYYIELRDYEPHNLKYFRYG